jgi:hypothetical protein
MSPVRYEVGLYIPEDGIHHSQSRENFKSYKCVRNVRVRLASVTFLDLNTGVGKFDRKSSLSNMI